MYSVFAYCETYCKKIFVFDVLTKSVTYKFHSGSDVIIHNVSRLQNIAETMKIQLIDRMRIRAKYVDTSCSRSQNIASSQIGCSNMMSR